MTTTTTMSSTESTHHLLRRVLPSAAVRVGGQLGGSLIGAVTLIVLTRGLSAQDFGWYVTASALVALVSSLADGGVVTMAVRAAASSADSQPVVRVVVVARMFLSAVAVAVVVAVAWAAYPGQGHAEVRLAAGVLAVTLPVGALMAGYQVTAESRLRVFPLVLADLTGRAVTLGFAVAAVQLHRGLLLVCSGAAVGTAASVACLWLTYGRRPWAGAAASRRDAVVLLRTAAPLAVALALNAVYFRIDTVMLSWFRPATDVATYGVAYRLLELTLSVGSFVLAGLLPVFANTNRNLQQWRATADVAFRLLFALGLTVAVCGPMVAHGLVVALGGARYAAGGNALAVLLLAGALSWVNGCGGTMLVSIDRQRDTLWLNVVAVTANVGLNVVLIPRWGYIAAAWTTAGCELVNFAGMVWLLRRVADYRWRITGLRGVLVLAAGSALATAGLRVAGLPAIVTIVVVGALWLVASIRLGVVPASLLRGRRDYAAVL